MLRATALGGAMDVMWSATSPESGRFHAVERCSDVRDLLQRFSELRSRNQGYLEVHSPERDYPLLTLGFRGDRAVIHLFSDAETCSLLVGDGATAADAVVDVPVMEELAGFTGHFVLDVDRAWAAVDDFVQTGSPDDLGEWWTL